MNVSDVNCSASKFENFTVADLRGTWREMGRQYGSMLAGHLRAAYEHTVERGILAHGASSRDSAERAAESLFNNSPRRIREYLTGMSETSGLELSQHILLGAVELLTPSAPARSSALATWGEYSAGGMVVGLCVDNDDWLKDTASRLVVTVFHPSDGSLAVATIGLPGTLCTAVAINERSIFAALNDGEPSGGALRYFNRVPASASLFTFLLDSPTLDMLESFVFSTRTDRAVILCAADDQTSRCWEWPVFDVKRRMSVKRPGLIVATDHFTEPSWGLPRPEDEKFGRTRTRRQNLLNLAEHFKGSIDMARMKKMLDTGIDELGASTPNTVYQLAASPGTMTISLKVPGITNWVDIQLGGFFSAD